MAQEEKGIGKKSSIDAVAKLASVSKMTVSRVVNNKGNVAPDTLQKVNHAIKELNFRPSALARGLATNTTMIIGMVLYDEWGNDFFREIIYGIQDEARRHGYDILFFANKPNTTSRPSFRSGLIDGIVCLGQYFKNETFEHLSEERVPYIVIGKRNWKTVQPCFYAPNYLKGFYTAANYLLELGHKKIILCGGDSSFEADDEKYKGCCQAFMDVGIEKDAVLWQSNNETNKLTQLFQTDKPTAIIVLDSKAWTRFALSAQELGLTATSDISIIGYDLSKDFHIDESPFSALSITRIDLPKYDLGANATRRLIHELEGQPNLTQENYLELELHKGNSCAPPYQEC